MKTYKILITGGSGFIGTNLIENFINQDITLLILTIKLPKKKIISNFGKK